MELQTKVILCLPCKLWFSGIWLQLVIFSMRLTDTYPEPMKKEPMP